MSLRDKVAKLASEKPELRSFLVPLLKKSSNPKKLEDLPPKEQTVAKKMMAKGYLYIAQFTTVDGNFGEPLYFKSANDVGPFLRSFPDYQKIKMTWTFKLEPEAGKTAMEHNTPEALKKYLHEHPKADKSKHHVKKQDGTGGGKKEKAKPLSKKEHQHTLPKGDKIRVYDAGEDAGMDRYTVIMDGEDWDNSANPGYKMSLGLSEGGRGISQWGEAKNGPHLGKPIKFDDLSEDTRKHITQRVESED